MGQLTNRKVDTAKAGKYGDGDGLQLVATATGARKWVLRYMLAGRSREMGLGSFPEVSLASARDAAFEARRLLAIGKDPIDAREASRKTETLTRKAPPTFAKIAALVIADAKAQSTNEKVKYQWDRHLGPAFCSALLERPVNEMTTLDVAAVLRPVWESKPEVARKLHPAIRRVFDRARVILKAEHGVLMPEFLILTNVRTDPALKAQWAEVDLDAAVWTIPLSKLKDGKHRTDPFRVPLAPRALEIINEMKAASSSNYTIGPCFRHVGRHSPSKRRASIDALWAPAGVSRRRSSRSGYHRSFSRVDGITSFPAKLQANRSPIGRC